VLLLYFTGGIVVGAGATLQSDKLGSGTVEFSVLDAYGKPLRSFDIVIFRESTDGLVRVKSTDGDIVTLPYGSYVVRVAASLHHPSERKFLIKEPRLLVAVALSFRDPGESPWVYGPPQKVRINPPSVERGRLWIRFVSLFGVFMKEATVNPSGAATMSEVPYGDYVVLVFHDSLLLKTLHFRRTLREETCSIELGERDQ
jgi:hypothetical protein